MRAITNRICRLEAHLAPHEGLESWRLANVLYERRRRRVEAAGEPFDGAPPERRTTGPRLSVVEMLRQGASGPTSGTSVVWREIRRNSYRY